MKSNKQQTEEQLKVLSPEESLIKVCKDNVIKAQKLSRCCDKLNMSLFYNSSVFEQAKALGDKLEEQITHLIGVKAYDNFARALLKD